MGWTLPTLSTSSMSLTSRSHLSWRLPSEHVQVSKRAILYELSQATLLDHSLLCCALLYIYVALVSWAESGNPDGSAAPAPVSHISGLLQ